ncbi:MAG: tetratricopeptide repeat protein [Candidatus Eisenbacteria bacterium]
MEFGKLRFCARATAILLLISSSATGAERGGVESPFAVGAGARALALGGAYTALAEGPDALVWNPAGLAGGGRKELTFYYTSPFVEGNRYTYVGYVHPLLDFGTVGFGNLRYGLDGIEKYDAGGEAQGTFSNVQNEWILSYALPDFGPVAVGASLKAETHSLDGRTATGVGVDLGVLLRSSDPPDGAWSRRNFAVGAAIRNAVEPTLTLVEGEDRLPSLLRVGVAYRLPAFGGGTNGWTVSAQIDQGRKSGGRFRLGAEVALMEGLALRAGAGGDEWSSGFGFAAGGGRLDYSFGRGDLGDAHRLALTVTFGRSLDYLREDRRVREQRILEERTLSELDRKERGQFERSLREGDDLLAAGDHAGAEAAYERALLWKPGDEEGLTRLSGARVEKHLAAGAGYQSSGNLLEAIAEFQAALAIDPGEDRAERLAEEARVAHERATVRNREVGDHLARGVEHLALSDFEEAREAFDEALRIDPENADARRFRVRVDSLVALRVDALVEEGDWYRDRGSPETSIERYRAALGLRPDRDDLEREIARLQAPPADPSPLPAAKAAAETAAPPPAPRRELTAEERDEAERMYRSGLDAFRGGRYPEAIRYFEFVYGLSPGFENVTSYLKQAALFHGMDLYTAGDLAAAIQTWERILEIDPEDERALSYVRRARSEIRKTQDLSGGRR